MVTYPYKLFATATTIKLLVGHNILQRTYKLKVSFGKYTGKSVELLMLKEPSYIKWVLEQQSSASGMAAVKLYVKTLIEKFDSKPIVGKNCCAFKECNNIATKFTVYRDNLDAYWWCDTCDPYQMGASSGKLQSPTDYRSALRHVESFCQGKKSSYSEIIKMISRAKGLPMRVGEAQAQKFFHG